MRRALFLVLFPPVIAFAGDYARDPCMPPSGSALQGQYEKLRAQTATLDAQGARFDAECGPEHPAGSAIAEQCLAGKPRIEQSIAAHDAQVAAFDEKIKAELDEAIAASETRLATLRAKMRDVLRSNRDMNAAIDEWDGMSRDAQREALLTISLSGVDLVANRLRAGNEAAIKLTEAQQERFAAWYQSYGQKLPEYVRVQLAARLARLHTGADVAEMLGYIASQGQRAADLTNAALREHWREFGLYGVKGLLQASLDLMHADPDAAAICTSIDISVDSYYSAFMTYEAGRRAADFSAVIGSNAEAIKSLGRAYEHEVKRREAARHALAALTASSCLQP